jgi:hypothetical protein
MTLRFSDDGNIDTSGQAANGHQGHGRIATVKQPQGLHAIVECRPACHDVLPESGGYFG